MSDENLFNKSHLSDVMRMQRENLVKEIKEYDPNKLLNTSSGDLFKYLYEKYNVNPIELDDQNVQLDSSQGTVDLRGTSRGFFLDEDDNPHVQTMFVEVHVPFKGDGALFRLRPSSWSMLLPRGRVEKGHLVFGIPMFDPSDSAGIKSAIDSNLANVRQHVEWQRKDIDVFNTDIQQFIREQIEARRKRILAEQNALGSLGFNIKKRDDSPLTYDAGVTKKVITQPAASNAPYQPEPTLLPEMYEEILSVIQRMTEVLERSPKAFAGMAEEDLRTHFLVQLNGQFESATGETFNASGKTDIYLPSGTGNVFVAECKFWSGEKGFSSIIDQLFGYITWRDTKTAVLLFSRNKNFQEVLDKAKVAAKSHPNFKRAVDYKAANSFRGVYGHPSDTSREVVITTIVFDVPQ